MTENLILNLNPPSIYIYGFELLSFKGAYFIATLLFVIFLYSYIVYLYKSQRSGKVDYEKYGKLAINDSLDDEPIESMTKKKEN